MSHTIKATEVRLEQSAVLAAARQLGYSAVMRSGVRMYDGTQVDGLAVTLPGWRFPLVVQADGSLVYDNYKGNWGNIEEIEKVAAYSMAAMAGASWPELVTEANGTSSWVMEAN